MRLLKLIVIVMALVIVAGGGVLVWSLAHHWNRLAGNAEAPIAAPASDSSYASVEVPAPAGMSFAQMAATTDRLILRFTGAQGERIVIIDPRTGRVAGTIAVTPSTP
jgi:hypothetical protein